MKIGRLLYRGTCRNCGESLDENSVAKFEYVDDKFKILSCQHCDTDCKPAVDTASWKTCRETLAQSIERARIKRARRNHSE